jgi:hypothetical protein
MLTLDTEASDIDCQDYWDRAIRATSVRTQCRSEENFGTWWWTRDCSYMGRACTTLQNGSLDNLDRVKGNWASSLAYLVSKERAHWTLLRARAGHFREGFSSTETSAVHERLWRYGGPRSTKKASSTSNIKSYRAYLKCLMIWRLVCHCANRCLSVCNAQRYPLAGALSMRIPLLEMASTQSCPGPALCIWTVTDAGVSSSVLHNAQTSVAQYDNSEN